MSRATISTGDIAFSTRGRPQASAISGDAAMHIALLGNFSGRQHSGDMQPGELDARRVIDIDRDNFEEVFSAMEVQLQLPITPEPIVFSEFDDLHPDFLYERLSLFTDLRVLKRRLNKPEHFAAAAEEIRQWRQFREEAAAEPGEERGEERGEPGLPLPENLLDSVLSAGVGGSGEPSAADGINRLIKDIVSPYIEARADPDLPAMLAAVDEATCELMRKICHASAFQQLEASWRAVQLLVRRLETDGSLRLHLVDLAREELLADLASCDGDLERSGLYRLLVERNQVPGATPFAIVNADYYIGETEEDLGLASALACIGEAAGAAVICGGETRLAGCANINQSTDPADWQPLADNEWARRWAELRARPESAHLALAAPRFLLRLPYGKKTAPIDSFDYRELPADGAHDYYLWGNSAYLVTLLLALHFQHSGWDFRPGQLNTLDDFPLHVYQDADGDEAIKPCAEVMLTDTAAQRLVQAGLLPVRSVKGSADIMIPLFPALARDTPIAGPWGAGRGQAE